jgi:amino acid adenylation domain-containing protein
MAHLLTGYIADQASAQPEKTAVRLGNDLLSYADLEGLSNRIARALKQSGCSKGDRVCLLVEKSPRAVAAMIGVMKADCSYVPLDIRNPAPRLAAIVQASAPRSLLCLNSTLDLAVDLASRLQGIETPAIGTLDEFAGDRCIAPPGFSQTDLDSLPDAPLALQSHGSDIAHILFTSGSTGKPKGVAITHSNVIAFIEWAIRYFRIDRQDRLSGHPPLHFDLSTFDIYGTLAAGAELRMVHPELSVLPNKLAEFIRVSELTQWFSVPAVLAQLARADAVKPGDFPALKRVLWCGEVLPTPVLMYWMERLPHAEFTNLYGPTETTIASSFHTVREVPTDANSPIPIGTPCGGEDLLVLDEGLRPVPSGQCGDLYISGAGLSPGYWNDPAKTNECFLRNDTMDSGARIYKTGDLARRGQDGLFYFLGRNDSQIKSRGYRIELGEIESALSAIESLRESAVVAIETSGFQANAICCAYVPVGSGQVTLASLRSHLSRQIPGYMLPHHWMALDSLPRNGNGKIDRPRLREAFERTHGKPADVSGSAG